MNILFESMKIKNMHLANRFVRSATYDGCADKDGFVTDKQIAIFSNLAAGGIGLIITGATYVHPRGQVRPFQNSIADDNYISGMSKLIDASHRNGAKIAIQLHHGGRESANSLRPKNMQAIAPSYIEMDPYFESHYRPMTENEVWEIINSFGDGARRAKDAGFDAVQIHGAHGYLLSQFLSPFTNHRQDEWGGDLINRLRIHREIYQAIKKNVGEDYPVLIKLGVQDAFPGGLEFNEGKQAAKLLEEWGFDALEISLGMRGKTYEETEFLTKINRLDREAYYRNWSREIKREVGVPVMVVGGLRTFKLMEEIIQQKDADFISLSRPLIREPGIINEWRRGNHCRPKCISCNKCLEALRQGDALQCFQQKSEENPEKTDED